jgi:hypothetical protein
MFPTCSLDELSITTGGVCEVNKQAVTAMEDSYSSRSAELENGGYIPWLVANAWEMPVRRRGWVHARLDQGVCKVKNLI